MSVTVTTDTVLQVKDLDAGYGSVPVLRQVSVQVRRGETVALLGSNGAGKSTLLRAISGMIPVFGGSVEFQGSPLRGVAPQKIARRGLCHVPEGRRLFAKQTVQDNLLLGMYGIRLTRAEEQERIDGALAIFPALTTRLADYAGFLSGGQQQMLAVALALVRQPDLIMLDEPSLGLAPVIIDEVFEALSEVSRRGGTVLLVEQLATRALRLADRAYVLAHGRITAEGSAEELLAGETLAAAYLGDTH
ncbi:ABC transporter ATP-binding protein [Nakamurella alba]|uniref:ABC transporter ATP-binding protein n=1 Tax=Nakamurella alba TaxID=2665158 RepID=UPI0012B89D06|nr:ABC transporter ATP-binding protein [Nakamurella alba]